MFETFGTSVIEHVSKSSCLLFSTDCDETRISPAVWPTLGEGYLFLYVLH
jgi:hypothetical protein